MEARAGQGVATAALALLLAEIRPLGLHHVYLTTDPDNAASQRVIQRNGGVFVEQFEATAYGKSELRWRIEMKSSSNG